MLNEKLKEIKKANSKTQIYIRADKSVTYDVLMKVMKQIIDSGILNVNLITLPKNEVYLVKFIFFSFIFHSY